MVGWLGGRVGRVAGVSRVSQLMTCGSGLSYLRIYTLGRTICQVRSSQTSSTVELLELRRKIKKDQRAVGLHIGCFFGDIRINGIICTVRRDGSESTSLSSNADSPYHGIKSSRLKTQDEK